MKTRLPIENNPLRGTDYLAVYELGRGGFGVVYAAMHASTTGVAVKVLHASFDEDPSGADRLRLEAETLQRADSGHLVRVFDTGRTADGAFFYAMELLRGQTLGAHLRARGPMSLVEAARFALQALHGLSAAHRLGVVHRDIKPENLFVCEEYGVLKILDFGIAKVVAPTPDGPAPIAVPTAEGMLVGSLRWCSPEAIASMPVDARTDIYSLGLVFHALLTGKIAWSDVRDQGGLVRAQLSELPASLDGILPAREAAVADALVLKLCAKRPSDRFASADEAAAAIEEAVRPFEPAKIAPSQAAVLSPPPAPSSAASRKESVTATARELWADERLWSFFTGFVIALVIASVLFRWSNGGT